MPDMPRPRPPYLHRQVTRHSKTVWYVRKGKGQRIRITAEFGTDEFNRQYNEAIAGAAPSPSYSKISAGSLRWAIDQYRLSSAWLALSPATRRQRENIFKHVIQSAGDEKLIDITRAVIVAGRERRAATPSAAKNFVAAMRGLFKWAIDVELVKDDPTQDVKVVRPKTDGFPPWTDSEIEKYRKRWPDGTRERHAFELIFGTGLRRGDAVAIGRQHIRDGLGRIVTEKTGETAFIPVDDLQAIAPHDDSNVEALTLIVGKKGRSIKKESFGNFFRKACRAAGVMKSAHGLRKNAATRDAEAGWSEAELEAKFGWRGGRMASHYTRAANREKMAVSAANRTRKKTES